MQGRCTGALYMGGQKRQGYGGTALVFPMVKFKDTVRVTLPWEEGPRSPSALRGLQLSKSRPSAMASMQIAQAEWVARTNPWKRPVRLLQHG